MAEIRLTDEVKAALIGVAPFSTSQTMDFTPAVYMRKDADGSDIIPVEARPVFVIRPFSKGERDAAIKLSADVEKADSVEISEHCRKIVKGWRNLFDAGTGEDIPFKADALGICERELWESIPPMIRGAIFTRCIVISGLMFGDKLGLK
jgi:hypothetical protein